MNIVHYLTVMAAAFAAGTVNAIAGGGTLLTFGALMSIGLTGQQANVTSTLSLWPGSIGGFLGYREDMAGARKFTRRLAPPSILGALAGAFLMLKTPNSVFDRLIPWLILTATLLMVVQDPISRWVRNLHGEEHERSAQWWMGAIFFQFLVGIYGGYFGAGIGILMLASLGMLGLTDIHQMNGVKAVLATAMNGVAILSFLAWEFVMHPHNVVWPVMVMMAIAATLGGLFGAHMAHRVGRKAVRFLVVGVGFSLTAWYFYKLHA